MKDDGQEFTPVDALLAGPRPASSLHDLAWNETHRAQQSG